MVFAPSERLCQRGKGIRDPGELLENIEVWALTSSGCFLAWASSDYLGRMCWYKPMTKSKAEILWLQEGVQIPRRTHPVDVACTASSGIFTQEDEGNDDCLLSGHRSVSSSGAIPRKRYELIGSKKTMLNRQ